MITKERFNTLDPRIQKRIKIEKRIVKSTVKNLLKAGYLISVFNGEEDFPVTTSTKEIYEQMMNTDEDYINVYKPTNKKKIFGWVRFIYGECGWDVICDNTINIEEALKETFALIGKICDEM